MFCKITLFLLRLVLTPREPLTQLCITQTITSYMNSVTFCYRESMSVILFSFNNHTPSRKTPSSLNKVYFLITRIKHLEGEGGCQYWYWNETPSCFSARRFRLTDFSRVNYFEIIYAFSFGRASWDAEDTSYILSNWGVGRSTKYFSEDWIPIYLI